MATKGNIVVDIKKENPLLTIIKAGKIPVVRLAKTGFQNFKQKRYFTDYRGGEYKEQKSVEKGCFVSILGVQGNYVCGGHYGESIHIGYLEPDETVFSTHFFDNSKNLYCAQTAKERFESAKKAYEIYQKGVNGENWDPDDFDLYSEAIVDSKTVKKALVIQPNEYQYLLPYCKDGMFRIFDEQTIFYHMVWEQCLSDEFATHLHWNLDASHHFFFKNMEVYSLMESSYYKEIVLKELVQYYTDGSFLHTSEYWEKFQNAFLSYYEKIKEFYPKHYDEEGVFRAIRKDCIHFCYEEDVHYRHSYTITTDSGSDTLRLSISKYKGWSYDKEYENFEFTEENILSKEYRSYFYKIVEMKNIFNGCMGEFRKIDFPKWMNILETFKNTEEALQKWNLNYTYDGENHEILFDETGFKFLYNLILLDGVVEVEEDGETNYYNLDKLPETFNRFWLDIILEALEIWRASF